MLDTKRGAVKNIYIFPQNVVCKELSNDGLGVARSTVIQDIRPGTGFKTGDFDEEKLGGLP